MQRFAYDKSLREAVNALKEAPCMDCGHRFHPCAMDFDHKPGSIKGANISTMVGAQYSLEDILEEIQKCDLVCSNCHRVRTWVRRKYKGRTDG